MSVTELHAESRVPDTVNQMSYNVQAGDLNAKQVLRWSNNLEADPKLCVIENGWLSTEDNYARFAEQLVSRGNYIVATHNTIGSWPRGFDALKDSAAFLGASILMA